MTQPPPPRRPLQGVRVVELARVFAAPWAAQQLADLGAEVVKLERAGRGDEFRYYGPPFLQDDEGNDTLESGYFLCVNRNKRSMTIDFTRPEGQALIRRMVAESDVFIENFKVGDLARFGLDYASLAAINPRLIYCSVTGFGQTGPYAKRPGTDSVFQALGGIMDFTGEPDGEPQKIGFVAVDFVTGLYATIAILAALRQREETGEGEYIDIALLDTAVAMSSHRAMEYLMTGVPPVRQGNGSIGSAPARVYHCREGRINVQAGGEEVYRRLCDLLGVPELKEDPRFLTRADRYRNVLILDPLIEAAFMKRTADEWYPLLIEERIVAAPVLRVDQTFADPQVVSRGLVVDMPHPVGGTVPTIASPMRFVGRDYIQYGRAPMLGEHTDEILSDYGLDADEIAGLRRAGAI